MATPPDTTVLFANLPLLSSAWLMGIDLQFFNLNRVFKGIKSIPEGMHLVHYSELVDTEAHQGGASALRYGNWIRCTEGTVHVFFWNEESSQLLVVDGTLLDYSKAIANLGEDYKYMVSYPGRGSEWSELTSLVDYEVIEEFLPIQNGTGVVSTIMPSREERMALTDVLNRDRKVTTTQEDEIGYTIIQFQRHRREKTGHELTMDHLDKSWYLEELFGHDMELLVAELQLSFVNFVAIGSFCSGMQWLLLAKLVLFSQSWLLDHRLFLVRFLQLLRLQLQQLPSELLVDELQLHNQLNVKTYVEIMEKFSDIVGGMAGDRLLLDLWHTIVTVNQKFNIDLDKLKPEIDSSNTEVFNLDDYDPNDEEMPVIV